TAARDARRVDRWWVRWVGTNGALDVLHSPVRRPPRCRPSRRRDRGQETSRDWSWDAGASGLLLVQEWSSCSHTPQRNLPSARGDVPRKTLRWTHPSARAMPTPGTEVALATVDELPEGGKKHIEHMGYDILIVKLGEKFYA